MQVRITLQELIDKGIVYIKNIQNGFNNYPNVILEGTEEYVNNVIRELVKVNGTQNAFADFYYGRLDEAARSKVRASLTKEEIKVIDALELTERDIFVKLSNELLEILLKLTASEVLFSSFYFTKYPCVVWGNYGRRYPVFFNDDYTMETVTSIVKI